MNKFIFAVFLAATSLSLQGMEQIHAHLQRQGSLNKDLEKDLSTLPGKIDRAGAPKAPGRPWKKCYFNGKNITRKHVGIVAAVATATWATYAARQVAKNVPQEEWNTLSTFEKCTRVAKGTLPEMASQAKRVALFCIGR